jgi:RNA polymerase sigma-70 factor (ECF subfamily)
MMAQASDTELLRSGRADDFGLFYERHVSAVTSYVSRRCPGQPELAFDLVAETFARALIHRTRYEERTGPAVAWLFAIAKNLIIDASRRGKVADATRRRLEQEPIVLTDDDISEVEVRGGVDLEAALASLPGDQRDLVLRRVLNEEPYPALASSVGCSEQVVRKRISRALDSMRRTIKEQEA